MKKNFVVFMVMLFAISLGISAFVPTVIADSNSDKKDGNEIEIQEFSDASVLESSSTTTVCHVPKGNPSHSNEIVVSTSSLTAHLEHGDYQGTC